MTSISDLLYFHAAFIIVHFFHIVKREIVNKPKTNTPAAAAASVRPGTAAELRPTRARRRAERKPQKRRTLIQEARRLPHRLRIHLQKRFFRFRSAAADESRSDPAVCSGIPPTGGDPNPPGSGYAPRALPSVSRSRYYSLLPPFRYCAWYLSANRATPCFRISIWERR